MNQLSFLIKPASSLCNMRCRYCFYADVADMREIRSYGLMSHDTARTIIEKAKEELSPGGNVLFAFQGGEPTVAGIEFFYDFFNMTDELLNGMNVSFSFQTNGLLLNDEWCRLFKERDILVGLSVDSYSELHDSMRIDASGKGTYKRIHTAMEKLKKHGVRYNILSVLTSSMARHPNAVWAWLQKESVEYVQFIPCLDELAAEKPSKWALSPSKFYNFYINLYPLWKKSAQNGHFISVKLYDDLINLYLAGRATACGITGRCSVQYVVEANGDVFPCDFYVIDEYRMGSLLDSKPSELYPNGEKFLVCGRNYAMGEPCTKCRYYAICSGGCKRLLSSMYIENGECYYAKLLNELLPQLLSFAKQYISNAH